MNHSTSPYVRLVLGACVVGEASPALQANGFRISSHDAFATARGEAFAATADNPSALYYNPAGIAQLDGHQVRGGFYGLYLRPTFDSPSGNTYVNERDVQAVPQLFYTYGPDRLPLSFGLGVYSPYGLSSLWPDQTGFRTLGTEGKLIYFTINPVVAWSIRPNLSIAAGLTVSQSSIDLRQGIVWPTQSNDEFKFQGDGWAPGYNLGLRWQPFEKLAFGASFRSPTDIKYGGDTEFYNNVEIPGVFPAFPHQEVSADSEFHFPLNVILGVSFRPTPQWNFEFNADWTDWSRLGTVTVQQTTPFPPLLPKDIPITLNWESSWYYEFGATRYLGESWSVSAGYIFNENSIPDAHYNPLVADLDRHFFCVGAGYHHRHLRVDLAYQLGYGPTRTVSGSAPSATGQTADGDYEYLSHGLSLTAQWSF